jgi:hypothetical protein
VADMPAPAVSMSSITIIATGLVGGCHELQYGTVSSAKLADNTAHLPSLTPRAFFGDVMNGVKPA